MVNPLLEWMKNGKSKKKEPEKGESKKHEKKESKKEEKKEHC